MSLTFTQSGSSLSSQLSLEQDVLDLAPTLQAAGIDILSFGPDVTTGLLDIGVADLTQSAVDELNSLFGATKISVEQVGQAVETTNYNRGNFGAAPWAGGVAIFEDGVGGCTAGFAIWEGQHSYFLTAAHCFDPGTTVRNGFATADHGFTGSGTNMGVIRQQDLLNKGRDNELIDANGSSGFLSGGTPTAADVGVYGYENSAVGMLVHNNGAYSGNVTSTIRQINQCQQVVEPTTRYVCALAHSTSNGIANQRGDSGGPVDHVINGYGYAVGTVSLSTTADSIACTYNQWTGCFTDLYATDVANSLSHYKASLNYQ